ncbi:hypothetical protein GALMADRAFT_1336346 [Galerina marginata CBS 339.88]|uniref:Uncharacterized protein n=1 Tax=Galerina marginata (strain CBS 339.88) TaxID=685588 RepID=A0A067STD7_GALM3|nr:hypothetical protein GALMADRAFT_1336346 [Galerina marginata CBS 339.88]
MSGNHASNSAVNAQTSAQTNMSQTTGGENSGLSSHERLEGTSTHRETSSSPAPDGDLDESHSFHLQPASVALLSACNNIVESFWGQKCSKSTALLSIHEILAKSIPNDPKSLDEAFAQYLEIIDNHENYLSRVEKRGRQNPSDEHAGTAACSDDEGHTDEQEPHAKQSRIDESEFPWNVADFIHTITLSPSLSRSLKLLQLYTVDPKGCKRSLTNSPTCPEFPDSKWTNVLAGRAINLDHVLSGYYSVSNNDERSESIGNVEIKFGTASPTKLVSTAGDWSIAWNRTSRATIVAFPHRAGELANYGEYIIGLFGATDTLFHSRVIAYDRAVRRRVGSRRDLELTDIHKFGDLKQLHMDSTGAAIIHNSVVTAKPGSSSRKQSEPCNRWNDGLCILDDKVCRCLHICNNCLKAGHKSPECHSKL